MNNRIEINIDWYKIIIEKEYIEEMTAPNTTNTPIQYNEYSIKRKYYKKWDPEYHRKPLKKSKIISTIWGSDKIVKQEPLLEPHYHI